MRITRIQETKSEIWACVYRTLSGCCMGISRLSLGFDIFLNSALYMRTSRKFEASCVLTLLFHVRIDSNTVFFWRGRSWYGRDPNPLLLHPTAASTKTFKINASNSRRSTLRLVLVKHPGVRFGRCLHPCLRQGFVGCTRREKMWLG